MRIEALDQEDADIDWFAVDGQGHILHVASGGGALPESVAASQEVLLELHQYFLTLPDTTTAEPGDPEATESGGYASHARYARRGLHSFAKQQLLAPADTQYQLVARPAQPLTVAALPPALQAHLGRTRWPASAAALAVLDTADLA